MSSGLMTLATTNHPLTIAVRRGALVYRAIPACHWHHVCLLAGALNLRCWRCLIGGRSPYGSSSTYLQLCVANLLTFLHRNWSISRKAWVNQQVSDEEIVQPGVGTGSSAMIGYKCCFRYAIEGLKSRPDTISATMALPQLSKLRHLT